MAAFRRDWKAIVMGQAQSAPAPPANVTPLLSGTADVLQGPSRDLECGGITAAPLHRWMVAAPHRSIEAAPVDQSSTSQRDGNLLSSEHSIFLSHSGAQKSFVEQLCLDIERHDRYPFFDKRRDSLPIGDDFPKLIFEAIDQCQVGVVVLSEEFFSRSKWPMLELVAMVKRRARDPKFVIMPVFLGVRHAQCRDKVNQARWLRIWEGWARLDKRIKVEEWEEALRVFGYTNGISLNDELDEVKCRGEIVEAVRKRVPSNTRWDDSHVQGRSHLSSMIRAEVERVEVCKSYGTWVLGIYGVGGMGKTTICKVLCNEYFDEFEGRVCHIEFGVGGMLQMLQEVLKRLTNTNHELIGGLSIDECKGKLKQGLKKKVFLAIDNVSDTQEIVDNAKEILRLGFMKGSIVIVTARSPAQLRNLNMEDCIQMPELEEEDAISLFVHHAAPGLCLNNMGEINERALKACIGRCYFSTGHGMNYHYHPLALKVLGGQLGNNPDEWMAKLDLYEGDPFNQYEEEEKDHPIFSILGRSFEQLKYEDQHLFMDVAIFFPEFNSRGTNIIEWLSMTHGKSIGEIMRRLIGLKSKSLVEDLGDGRERIALHDLWHKFALMKAKGSEFDQQPWINEKVYGLNDPRREGSVVCRGGWENLRRISMVGDWRNKCVVKELSLSRCSNLRMLKLVDIAEIETQVLDLRSVTQLKSLELSHYSDNVEVHLLGLGCLRNLAYLKLSNICTDLALLQEQIASLTNLQVLLVADLLHETKSGRLASQEEERSTTQKWGWEGRSVGQFTGDAAGGTLERENGESGSFAGAEQQTPAKGTENPTRKNSRWKEWRFATMFSPKIGGVPMPVSRRDWKAIIMGQAQSAPASPANVTPLLSGTADVLQRPSHDRECGGITAAPLPRSMVAAPHRSIEAAPVDQSSTSQRDGTLLSSKHSIFLSHSGAQKSFVEQLCLDIERHDRYPFFNKSRDSLPVGDDFPKLIFEAIDQCQVGVVVLSEEFFSRSKWPMLELVAMVKRRARDPKFVIMPVFLGVRHAQCRDKVNQARWLRIWEGWAKVDKRIKVEEWEEALRMFGYMNGISLNDGLGEVKCRVEIVEAIRKRVLPNTRWDYSHIMHGGSRLSMLIHAKVERVEVCKSYGAQVLGIYGVGGMGKTTICKVLCNEYFDEFKGRVCHIEFGASGMLQMLQEVLKRLTNTNHELIGGLSIDECKGKLKQGLKKKVFLTIDNVSNTQEIVDNAKEILRLGFMEGSIVIVTARSLALLEKLNLEDCLEMPELGEEDAISLLLHHAAPRLCLNNMGEINIQALKRCVSHCHFFKGHGMNYHYHPLALKVLGGQLGNNPDEWMAKLDLYEEGLFKHYEEMEKDHPIFFILGRSFELLEYEDQLLFMDAAIFFPKLNSRGTHIIKWLSLTHGKSIGEIMQRLIGLKSKSLVEDLGDGRERIALHDLWVEFALMKAEGRALDQRSWIKEKVYGPNDPQREESVLCRGGWKNLERISMVGDWWNKCVVKELILSRSSNLRVLKLVDIETQVLDLRSVTQLKSLELCGFRYELEVHLLGLGCLRNLAYLKLSNICTDLALLLVEIASLTNLQVMDVFALSHKRPKADDSWQMERGIQHARIPHFSKCRR